MRTLLFAVTLLIAASSNANANIEKTKFKCGVFKTEGEKSEERHQYGFATFESPNPDSVINDNKAWVNEITLTINETIDSRKSATLMPLMPRNRGVLGNEGSLTKLADPVYGYADKNTDYPRYVLSIIKSDEPSFLTLHVNKDETLIARCEVIR